MLVVRYRVPKSGQKKEELSMVELRIYTVVRRVIRGRNRLNMGFFPSESEKEH